MTNSNYGRHSVFISGCEIPIIVVPEDVLPANVLFIIPRPTAVMELDVSTKGPSITSRITISNASLAMALKVVVGNSTKKRWTNATGQERGTKWKSPRERRRNSGK